MPLQVTHHNHCFNPMEQSRPWFKSSDDHEKLELQNIVNETVVERTKEINEHIAEKNRIITNNIRIIGWQLDELEEMLRAQATNSPEQQAHSLQQIIRQLEKNLLDLVRDFEEYATLLPEYQREFQQYKIASAQLHMTLDTMEQTKNFNDNLVAEWEEHKKHLRERLEEMQLRLISNENDEASHPVVYN